MGIQYQLVTTHTHTHTHIYIYIYIKGVKKIMVQISTVGIPKTMTFSRINKSSKSRRFRDSES